MSSTASAAIEGLETLDVGGAPHDCLRVIYAGGDKLFVPVENIDVLSRYGSEDTVAELDRLGGVAWQARKAKARERIREIAAAADQDRRRARRFARSRKSARPRASTRSSARVSPTPRPTTSSAPSTKS